MFNTDFISDDRFAHSLPGRPNAEWERLAEHLSKVAISTAEFASAFDAKDWGEILGICHDLGKLSDEFQSYLHIADSRSADAGVEEEQAASTRVDHSTFGARFVAQAVSGLQGHLLAFCIAGHHTGLPDECSAQDVSQRATLRYRLDSAAYTIPHVAPPSPVIAKLHSPLKPSERELAFQVAFFTRMLFSCLIDADRTRTEEFCDPKAADERSFATVSARPSLRGLRDQLDCYLATKTREAKPTEVNVQRANVLAACRLAASLDTGFFSLNVPTGGGKTLSSLAFALEHALRHNLRRVVVAIPFTSIIEQTADVYREALGSLAASAVVEHHSNLHPSRDTRSNQLGSENWDAPLIVTTNVQLLESLFAYRTTPCRKLHNLSQSVIVLDEAQTIPVELLRPALAALRELVLNYGCSIVLCTATQPALEHRADFEIGLRGVRPIIPDAVPLFTALRRVEVRRVGPEKLSDDELTSRLAEEHSVLCIVNTRKQASRLYDGLVEISDRTQCFHLSTWMCAEHRRTVLRRIRERLSSQEPCRVVSTQLVEAGVDLDFPTVYRAEAGFDSIAQAAGRCNREGKLALGFTYVFEAEERPPVGLLRTAADTAKELASHYPDPLAPEAVEAYFRLFYWAKKSEWDRHGVMMKVDLDRQRGRPLFQFREMADAFRMIRDDQLPVLVPYALGPNASNAVWDKLAANIVPFLPQRELQPYLVSVRKQAVQQMQQRRFVVEHESGLWILLNRSLYSREKGLNPDATTLDAALWGV